METTKFLHFLQCLLLILPLNEEDGSPVYQPYGSFNLHTNPMELLVKLWDINLENHKTLSGNMEQ